jgi:hypothetical protein
MEQSTATLIVAGIGICGTLGGVLAGQYLTQSWQRKQWLLDNTKQEYRELLSTIAVSYGTIKNVMGSDDHISPEKMKVLNESQLAVLRVLRDRIFVATNPKLDPLYKMWTDGTYECFANRNFDGFKEYFDDMSDLIVECAHEDLNLTHSL